MLTIISEGPYYGVVSYDWQYGSIPFFYYTYPTATYPTQMYLVKKDVLHSML